MHVVVNLLGNPWKLLKLLLSESSRDKDLVEATERGELDIVKYLVRAGVSEEARDEVLVKAAERGELEIVKYLVEAGVSDEARDEVLVKAAERGELKIVKYLVEAGMSDEAKNKALVEISGSYINHFKIVECLVEEGVSKKAKDKALLKAADRDDLRIVKFLSKKEVSEAAKDKVLVKAADRNNLRIVKCLLKARVSDAAKDKALVKAAAKDNYHINNFDTVKCLVRAGVSDEARDEALVKAACRDKLSIVEYLVKEEGVSKKAKDKALVKAAAKDNYHINNFDTVKCLVRAGVSDEARDEALVKAACRDKLSIVEYLVKEEGVSKKAKDKALLKAACRDKLSIVEYLVKEAGVSDEAKSKVLESIKFTSYNYKFCLDIIKYIARVNINFKDKNSNRLIDLANKQDDYESVKELRNLGSVEPKSGVLDVTTRLDTRNERLDGYEPNKKNAPGILKLLYQKFPVDDEDKLIKEFKKKLSDPLQKKINDLCELTSNHDRRLSCKWEFKKVLASVIHLVNQKENKDLEAKLILYIDELRGCAVGKLINILYLIQNYVLDDNFIDYDAFKLEDYETFLKEIYDELDAKDVNVARWYIDMKFGNIVHADKWHNDTQIIHGIFNRQFQLFVQNQREKLKIPTDNRLESYHFNEGLITAISLLLTEIKKKENINPLVNDLKSLVKKGENQILKELLEKASNIDNEEDLKELFKNVLLDKEKLFGLFELIDTDSILLDECSKKMNEKGLGGLFSNLVIDNFNLPEGCGLPLMGCDE